MNWHPVAHTVQSFDAFNTVIICENYEIYILTITNRWNHEDAQLPNLESYLQIDQRKKFENLKKCLYTYYSVLLVLLLLLLFYYYYSAYLLINSLLIFQIHCFSFFFLCFLRDDELSWKCPDICYYNCNCNCNFKLLINKLFIFLKYLILITSIFSLFEIYILLT